MVTEGRYQIAITPSLRELFTHTHAQMSGRDPESKQYPFDEQYEMYLVCQESLPGKKQVIDPEKTEDNLLELLHYLHESGVAVPAIIAEIRCFGDRTKGVAMRMRVREVGEHKKSTKAQADSLFSHPAPAYA